MNLSLTSQNCMELYVLPPHLNGSQKEDLTDVLAFRQKAFDSMARLSNLKLSQGPRIHLHIYILYIILPSSTPRLY